MLPAALLACAVGFLPPSSPRERSTLEAVIAVESGGRADATHRNRNGTVDYGLMQVNSANLPAFGLTPAQALDPCTNIRVGSTILRANYAAAVERFGEGQRALMAALSAYNTGDFRRGFENGYVRQYYVSLPRLAVVRSLPRSGVITASTAPRPLDPYKADPQVPWRVDADPY